MIGHQLFTQSTDVWAKFGPSIKTAQVTQYYETTPEKFLLRHLKLLESLRWDSEMGWVRELSINKWHWGHLKRRKPHKMASGIISWRRISCLQRTWLGADSHLITQLTNTQDGIIPLRAQMISVFFNSAGKLGIQLSFITYTHYSLVKKYATLLTCKKNPAWNLEPTSKTNFSRLLFDFFFLSELSL